MRRARTLFVVGLVLLTLVNLFWPETPSPLSASTFGRSGSGHGALYDLLEELDASRGRSLEAVSRLEGAMTLWWIDPLGVCDGRIALEGEVDVLDPEDVAWQGGDWIRGGGTGVVFLQSAKPGGPLPREQEELARCDAIAGVPLPRRKQLAPDTAIVSGAPLREDRRLPYETPFSFDPDSPRLGSSDLDSSNLGSSDPESPDPWEVVLEVRAGADPQAPRAPFALARSLGEGRLVVVADSGFTHNRWLDGADAAPLAADLARSFGPPRFDEREHGFLPETSAFRFVAASEALPVFAALALLGGLYAWRGAGLPARSVAELDPAAPTLENFVQSMAGLYARSGDHGRILERYRELTAARLRRHFGLPHEVSPRALAERIQRERPIPPERLARLVEPQTVATAGELRQAALELDRLVWDVVR